MLHALPDRPKAPIARCTISPPHYLAVFLATILAATHSQSSRSAMGPEGSTNDILLDICRDNRQQTIRHLIAGHSQPEANTRCCCWCRISGFSCRSRNVRRPFGSRGIPTRNSCVKALGLVQGRLCGRLKPGAKRILMNARWHEGMWPVADARIRAGTVKGKIIDLSRRLPTLKTMGAAAKANICGTSLTGITTAFSEGETARSLTDDVVRALPTATRAGRRLVR